MTTTDHRRRLAFMAAVASADLALGGILASLGADAFSWGVWGVSLTLALAGVAIIARQNH